MKTIGQHCRRVELFPAKMHAPRWLPWLIPGMIYRLGSGQPLEKEGKTHDPVHMSKHLSLGGKAGDPPLTHVPSMQESCESRARLRLSETFLTRRKFRRERQERNAWERKKDWLTVSSAACDPFAVDSWTNWPPVSRSGRSPSPGSSSPRRAGTWSSCSIASTRSSIVPWSSTPPPRRPKWSLAAGTSSVAGICPPRQAACRGSSPPRCNATWTTSAAAPGVGQVRKDGSPGWSRARGKRLDERPPWLLLSTRSRHGGATRRAAKTIGACYRNNVVPFF